ncbi:DUF4381 domain-containing protein [Pseudoxanthomonas composti]|uniref:DUF4381 domain-containing protein n=1 Tax=Pseudoxanthomonas composti TaxID=2137479 RepID=A0A4Q1JTF3_9GAMM|nr:DUF4381 domain-containing protein [Pseudoxanthomonas composti]RXR04277.1 DUF4381 domain-containing protein [Pseudoxanthomonas composti]
MSPAADTLVLRDVHVPAAPGLWPPAPGWWIVIGVVVAVLLWSCALGVRRQRRQASWRRLFDEAAAQPTPAEQVAAVSSLLRRAARRLDPQADRLSGQAWLRWLDGRKGTQFTQGPGRLLLEGAFARSVDPQAVAQLLPVARARFLQLMAGRK